MAEISQIRKAPPKPSDSSRWAPSAHPINLQAKQGTSNRLKSLISSHSSVDASCQLRLTSARIQSLRRVGSKLPHPVFSSHCTLLYRMAHPLTARLPAARLRPKKGLGRVAWLFFYNCTISKIGRLIRPCRPRDASLKRQADFRN